MTDFSKILTEQTVFLDIEPFEDKEEMFQKMASWYKETGIIDNVEAYIEALYEREAVGSTIMGRGIAVPHAKCGTVKKESVMFCRLKEPFLYESYDEKDMIKYVFMLAVSDKKSGNNYIALLAHLAGLLLNDDFLQALKTADTCQEIIEVANKLD